MRLLKLEQNSAFRLVEYFGDSIPPYAILSHTWGADDEEMSFEDVQNNTWTAKAGIEKLRFCQRQIAKNNLDHCWIDTCCIDKKNANELTEAINSMFQWYRKAQRCYVYLSDVSSKDESTKEECTKGKHSRNRWKSAFKQSRWFKRGWTLQELLAPLCVEFYSHEGARLGDKFSLIAEIQAATGIDLDALRGAPLSSFSPDQRISWSAGRQTKRAEDKAYSLFGIFDIHLPLIYGEGHQNAMRRLLKAVEEQSKDASSPSGKRKKHQSVSHRVMCYKCRKPGHFASDPHCFKCREYGHIAADLHCYKCGKHGYYANDDHCYRCKEWGHYANACPT